MSVTERLRCLYETTAAAARSPADFKDFARGCKPIARPAPTCTLCFMLLDIDHSISSTGSRKTVLKVLRYGM